MSAAETLIPDDTPEDGRYDEWSTFHIDGDRLASWALRKLAEAKAEIERLQHNTDDEIAGLREKLATDVHPHQNTVSFMVEHLERYRLDLEDANPNLPKTYKLPCGTLGRRKSPPRVEVVDEEALIGWALDNDPSLVRMTPDKSAIKQATTRADDGSVRHDTGHEVPGVALAGGEERIIVTAAIPIPGPF